MRRWAAPATPPPTPPPLPRWPPGWPRSRPTAPPRWTGYPHDLAGDPAPPPAAVDAAGAGHGAQGARQAPGRGRPAAVGGRLADPRGRPARCWCSRRGQRRRPAPEHRVGRDDRGRPAPGRERAARARLGVGSQRVGALAGTGVVRAFDITNDPALGLPAVAERLRARALAGHAAAGGRRRVSDPGRADHRRRTGRGGASTPAPTRTSPTCTCRCPWTRPVRLDRPWHAFTSEQPAPPPPRRRRPGVT
jgi:hypothetical protein